MTKKTANLDFIDTNKPRTARKRLCQACAPIRLESDDSWRFVYLCQSATIKWD